MNAYELAGERFNRAGPACLKARREAERIVRDAEAEYAAAEAALTAFESSPGVPLPEYRSRWADEYNAAHAQTGATS